MNESRGRRQFATTNWSVVSRAGRDGTSQSRAREALGELCRLYWFPLYAFVRCRGYSSADAQDLTQAFFAQIIETHGLAGVDRGRGRFRSYLLGAMKHFLANEWHKGKTQKRGGTVTFAEWDAHEVETRYCGAAVRLDDPDQAFDREWALESVAQALRALREEMVAAGKSEQFAALKGSLTGDESLSREEIAARLGMSEGAVKVAVHRLRKRYRDLLRAAIAETVCNEADLDEEIRYLVSVLRRH